MSEWNDLDEGFLPAVVYGSATPVAEAPTPRPEGTVECEGPCVDGVYHGAGGTVNGKFVGFTGKCYRCGGKGYQTKSDARRNAYYDNHVRRFSV